MRDFTLDIYRELLETLQAKGYTLLSYADYCQGKRPGKFVIMRHDVDAKPENSLQTAQIEKSIGAKASYYFRTPESGCYKNSKLNLPDVIRGIVHLGHEIGYHYEDMSLCNGDIDKAWSHFRTWLATIVSDNDADLRTLDNEVNGDSTFNLRVVKAFSIALIE